MNNFAMTAAAALLIGGAVSAPAQANDGIIEFEGTISDATCLVEGQAPGSGNIQIGPVEMMASKGDLAAAAQVAGTTPFSITIGGAGDTGCTNGVTAKVAFDGTMIDAATGRLNVDAGGAQNVQIQLLNGDDDSVINLATGTSAGTVIANNTAVINLKSELYATAAATSGVANSRVGFTVDYD